MFQSPLKRWLLPSLVLLLPLGAASVDRATLQLAAVEGEDWTLTGVEIALGLPAANPLSGEIRIASLRLAATDQVFKQIEVSCARLTIDARQVRCADGRFSLADWRGPALQGGLDLSYDRRQESLQLSLDEVALAEGYLHGEIRYREGQWRVNYQGSDVSLAGLAQLYPLEDKLEYSLSAGRADITGQISGQGAQLEQLNADLQLTDMAFSNRTGLAAGEGLSSTIVLGAAWQGDHVVGDLHVNADAGGFYLDPVYTEFANHPVAVSAQYRFDTATQSLELNEITVDQKDTVRAELAGRVRAGATLRLESVEAEFNGIELDAFFPTYVSPWLAGTAFSDLKMQGRVSGSVNLQEGQLQQFNAQLRDVDLNDPQQRLSLNEVTGNLAWGRDEQTRDMQLRWQGGSLYRFDLGPASFRVRNQGRHYALLEPAEIAVLDGMLMIDEWELSQPGSDDMEWRINAILTPVSMQRVTEALEWPPMQGRLSGVIPDVKYAQGQVEVGGMLLVRAFDGAVRLRNVRLDQPLGLVPQFYADIELENIDLEQLTGTFSFGKIEGRLGGYVRDLWLQNWEPVAFDAKLATPEGDDSRHRISQKAVDNLSQIGGGVGQALSQTFLGFFETFPYDRLGISCRLHDGVCEMGGVAPAEQGYYLVKGTWLPPRINVIGYAEQVDWDALVARIQAATTGGAPQVQ